MYEFVQKYSPDYSVGVLCEVVGVSRSAYYAYITGQTYRPAPVKKQQQAALQDMVVEDWSKPWRPKEKSRT